VRQRTDLLLSKRDNRFTLLQKTVRARKGSVMNHLSWMGIVVLGAAIAAFGLLSSAPLPVIGINDVQAQDVLFLMSGGLMTSLIGAAGLFGVMERRQGVAKRTK